MTRKTKIRIAVALVVLGVMAIAVWPGEDEGTVRITFAGVSATNSARVSFTITNRSTRLLFYETSAHEHQSEGWRSIDDSTGDSAELLDPQSAKTEDTLFSSTNRWRFCVAWYGPAPNSFATRVRSRLGEFAENHNWGRVGEWVMPKETWKVSYGPEMLGNKPAATQQ